MTTMAARLEAGLLERKFRFAEHGTTLARDTFAGMTTFVVMSYIIFVNPAILSFAGITGLENQGLAFDAVLASTCLVAGVMTILMGLVANKAYAIAPQGMGLNAVVAFGLVTGAGLSWPEAMGIVVLEGALVTAPGLDRYARVRHEGRPARAQEGDRDRHRSVHRVHRPLQLGPDHEGRGPRAGGQLRQLHDLARFHDDRRAHHHDRAPSTRLPRRSAARDHRNDAVRIDREQSDRLRRRLHRGCGVAERHRLAAELLAARRIRSFGAFATLGVVSALVWVFALFLSDFFDTMGTLVGVGKPAGYLNKDGEMDNVKRPLLVDSLSAMAGGAASSSSATTYIESGAGVAAGGRTGWTSVVTGALFFPFLFLAPLIGMVPPQATAPALIIVGWLLISSLTESEGEAEEVETGRTGTGVKLAGIDFHDLAIGLSAALIIMIMPFTWSITNGIGFGFIAYTLVHVAEGDWRKVHPFMFGATGRLHPLLHDPRPPGPHLLDLT